MSGSLPAFASPARRLPIPTFGPYRVGEAVPWLLLAAAFRVLGHGRAGLDGWALWFMGEMALFLAFVTVARQTIELADGTIDLGPFSLGEQMRLAWAVIGRVLGALLAVALILRDAGYASLFPWVLNALDGIAFDQLDGIGIVWSCAVSCLVLLMVVGADRKGRPRLVASLVELVWRARFLAPAIGAAAAAQFVLMIVQRWAIAPFWAVLTDPLAPVLLTNGLFFGFVLVFAILRLWITLAVLTIGLRASYRASASDAA